MSSDPYLYTDVKGNPFHRELAASVLSVLKLDREAEHVSLRWRHHGIGVLQAYLVEGAHEVRVHVWHPDLVVPGIEHSGQIHDHRFHLRSSVLAGSLRHVEYRVREEHDGPWRKYEVLNARKGVTDPPAPLPGKFHATRIPDDIKAGQSYEFPTGYFHATVVTEPCVTIVAKSNQTERQAIILAPAGAEPVHAFKNPLPTEKFAPYLEQAIALLEKA
jgi:hypothetical protein